MTEILYVEEGEEGEFEVTPYIYTESAMIKNLAKAFDQGDVTEDLGNGLLSCYYEEEYKPFLSLLDSTGIEYRVVLKSEEWFQTKGGI